jgi:hypothetical protein
VTLFIDPVRRLLAGARTSKYLKLHEDSQEYVATVFFLIGALSFLATLVHVQALLPVVVYGKFVVGIGANVWALMLMGGSSIYFFGIQLNGDAPVISSTMRLVGAILHFTTLATFCLGAFKTAGAEFFVISAFAFALSFLRFAFMNLLDLIGALKREGL